MKRFPSPLIRSFLLHFIFLIAMAALIYWKTSDSSQDSSTLSTITLEEIVHKAIHSIGIPHQEPVKKQLEPSGEKTLNAQTDSSSPTSDEEWESAGISPSELQIYFQELVRRIHQVKKYPKEARFNEQEGVVRVLLEIAPGGQILKVQLEKESPFKSLNDAAVSAIRDLGALSPLPVLPNGQPPTRSITLHIPIHFQLK